MRVGGPVRYLAYPLEEGDLLKLLHTLKEKAIAYRFIGNGTNIIMSDRGLNEAAIRLTKMKHLRVEKRKDGASLEVSAGTPLKGVIRGAAQRGLSGLEKLYWIPGTIGGAVKMNAGSFGASISDALEGLRMVDDKGTVTSLERQNMAFGYRASPVKRRECVLSARFHLRTRNKKEILQDMEYVYTQRRKRHPMDVPSAGSVFKAVDGEPAWKFVENAGLKGFRIGNACISEKHANFIVNLGSATAEDVKHLIEKVKKEVYEHSGVSLEEEVELWGFDE